MQHFRNDRLVFEHLINDYICTYNPNKKFRDCLNDKGVSVYKLRHLKNITSKKPTEMTFLKFSSTFILESTKIELDKPSELHIVLKEKLECYL
jgi:hypothetical protein